MRSQFVYTGVALLLSPSSSLSQSGNCEAPPLAQDQVMLQGRAGLQRSLSIESDALQSQLVEEARKDLKGDEKKAERRRHLDSVMEQASELIRHRAGVDTMKAAGQEMEVIDERVLPEIMAEHKSASLALELQWGMFALSEGLMEDQAKGVAEISERARKREDWHVECREKEAAFLDVVETCEKELKAIMEEDAFSHVGPHPAGFHQAPAHQHGMDASRENTKKTHCESLNAQRKMVRVQCEHDQHMSEQEFCMARSEAAHARGKVADGYTMALFAYESAASHVRAEEAERKNEFGIVEAVRCLKEHFLAAAEGSVADPAWLDECNKAKNDCDTSGLDLTLQEPRSTLAAAVTIKPEETPCSPEFVKARHAALPSGVKVAPCALCTAPSDKPISTSSGGHGGHSDKFWFGFHQGVRAASGHAVPSPAHVETFQKKISAEGAENNLARFQTGLVEKVLHQLPSDWASHLDQEVNHGFMNGYEAGMEVTAEEEKKIYKEKYDESEEKINKSLARASEALDKALDLVKVAHSKAETTVQTSSGFQEVSEDVQVLPLGENSKSPSPSPSPSPRPVESSKVNGLEATVQTSSGFQKVSEDVEVLPFGEI